ncbi:MAG: ribosome-binding ATPase YchF [Gammaproteobacteria bacterium]|nr:MAG: ribosome-binding ATPase YchF [Gammaproteobacteria bacterium]
MGFKCGIVGLPNVGKSTLFNAITNASIPAENFPFCTIEPNVGVVSVPDDRLINISLLSNSSKLIHATTTFVDIAGLVKGASDGEGLGNEFLSNIREVNAIVHVVRCFKNEKILHVNNKVDPISDFKTIYLELLLADIQLLEKRNEKLLKLTKVGNPSDLSQQKVITELIETLSNENEICIDDYSESEKSFIDSLNLLTLKPYFVVGNISDDEALNDINQIEDFLKNKNVSFLPTNIKNENEISNLEDQEKKEYLELLNMDAPVLDKIIVSGYKILGLETFFTTGENETKAWTIPHGSIAPSAAGIIHTDFEKGFIKAEVIAYNDFIDNKGYKGSKDNGKLRIEGKDYVVKDGDIILFKFNV